MDEPAAGAASQYLARNLKSLREALSLTQQQVADRSGVPRATLAHLESGDGNPTLAVLMRVASALNITIEELIGPPRSTGRLYRADQLPVSWRTGVRIGQVLPDRLPGIHIERLTIPVEGGMRGAPHTPGTREYLTCERGRIQLTASGMAFELGCGDTVVFRGDQKHGYRNVGDHDAIAYSIVLLPPPGS
jgi:transcriptional regulator with XRE-family HTH domain